MEFHEHVALVEFPAQKRLQTQLAEVFVGLGAFLKRILKRGLLRGALFHLGKFVHDRGVLDRLHQGVVWNDVCALGVGLGDHLAGLGRTVPEVRPRLLGLERRKRLATIVDFDVVGHLSDALLQIFDALTHLFDFQQFLLFRHGRFSLLNPSILKPFNPSTLQLFNFSTFQNERDRFRRSDPPCCHGSSRQPSTTSGLTSSKSGRLPRYHQIMIGVAMNTDE